MNYNQIVIMFLQGALVASVILLLFRLRKRLGIGILFACLGLFQFIQVFLSSTVYKVISENLLVSPGSTVLFTATLFTLLIIYIKEDANETRKIIYALLIVNIVMAILFQTFSWNFEDATTYNPLNVSSDFFSTSAWILVVGTVTLFLDSILIIVLYEYISRYTASLFLRMCSTMILVVSFDSLFFLNLAFYDFDNLSMLIYSGLVSKGVFAIFYSMLFYFYLKYLDTYNSRLHDSKVKDVFEILTYRQKFESATEDFRNAEKAIAQKDIHYKNLTDISPVGIFRTRSDGYTTFVNQKWSEISGIPSYNAKGWDWINAVHPDDRPLLQKEWDISREEKRIAKANYRFVMDDGTFKWVLGQVVPEYNNQNELIGFIGTITDISDLKSIQKELRLLRDKAEESNRLKSAFLANMSHEIRTPMNGILGFASLLKQSNLTIEAQNNYIDIIEKSGLRMLNIINDIISISKIESGLVEVHTKEFNINEQQEYLNTFFKPEAEAKGLTLTYTSSLTTEEAVICTDQDKFMSIYTNLIKNAVKYTEKGSIEFGYARKKKHLEFYVMDTGIGIDFDRQEAIFERFIQADIEDKMARQGAGLGLSITKAFVEMLGGRIWVESSIDKGSKFFFSIPFEASEEEIDDPEDLFQDQHNFNQLKDLNILLVEDDDISAMLISIMLKNSKCNLTRAHNGIEAVDICKKKSDIDFVLMDVRMPLMDGYEATHQIRKFNKDLIIVAQTAHALSSDREKSMEVGCNEHLSKPIMRDELFAIINSYFN
jgi:PAS domain S-box-containing protein